ncbi:hypothetical protein [Candidatus Poriferisodalis sp.]|uniref:hypothetical protein n=1 Tax=Candidatus Poriferisodalis sp. TaxID=3101277 RepID=UPI003AF71696
MPAPPRDGASGESSHRNSNGLGIAGFVVSIVAVVPPLWFALLALGFAEDNDDVFVGLTGFLLFVFVILPIELITATPAVILCTASVLSAKRDGQASSRLGVIGLIVSLFACALTVTEFVIIFY